MHQLAARTNELEHRDTAANETLQLNAIWKVVQANTSNPLTSTADHINLPVTRNLPLTADPFPRRRPTSAWHNSGHYCDPQM